MNIAKHTAITLAGLLVAAALALPAHAVDDTTPPVIDSDDAAAFVVGSNHQCQQSHRQQHLRQIHRSPGAPQMDRH